LTWSDLLDLNESFIYMFREFVYPCMAKNTSDDAVHFIYETADTPGSAVADENIAPHDNTIEYRSVLKADVLPLGARSHVETREMAVSQNYPNPFSGSTTVNIRVDQPSKVTFLISDLIGRTVRTIEFGTFSAGVRQVSIDASGLNPGIYSYTARIGDAACTRTMIVK
jgi:hypothetical protein